MTMAFMPNDLQHEWNRFLEGEWTDESPTRPGIYRLATRLGDPVTETLVVYEHDGKLGFAMHGAQSDKFSAIWGGYVWSIPTPDLPRAPECK
jgi:hypothetical protein